MTIDNLPFVVPVPGVALVTSVDGRELGTKGIGSHQHLTSLIKEVTGTSINFSHYVHARHKGGETRLVHLVLDVVGVRDQELRKIVEVFSRDLGSAIFRLISVC